MTWLELIKELRKQPVHLLENDVIVWNFINYNNGCVTNLVGAPYQLLTQDKDIGLPDDWGPDGSCILSLECEYDVPEEFFTKRKDFGATVQQYTDAEYTYTISRKQMRDIAARFNVKLNDEQCEKIAGYLIDDCLDDALMEHYIENKMI